MIAAAVLPRDSQSGVSRLRQARVDGREGRRTVDTYGFSGRIVAQTRMLFRECAGES